MPYETPLCPECNEPLPRPGLKTCGKKACQNRRQRKLTAENRRRGAMTQAEKDAHEKRKLKSPYAPEVQGIARAAAQGTRDVTAEITRELVRPVIMEAVTDEVVQALKGLVALSTEAIEALGKDIASEDPVTRQRAYELVLRYTVGHKSLAPPSQEQAPQAMTVVLNVPGSGADVDTALKADAIVAPDDIEEDRECESCHIVKPESQFVGSSDRCMTCHDEVTNRVKARFG